MKAYACIGMMLNDLTLSEYRDMKTINKNSLKNNVILIALSACSAVSSAYAVDEQQQANDCKKIATYALSGQKLYDAGDYAKARDSFIEQVGWSESCQLPDTAIATAYNNVALTFIKQKDFLKAKAWLLINDQDKKSQYNLGLIKNDLAKLAKIKSPVGEYWQYAGKGAWNSVAVEAKDQQYRIQFAGLYMGMMAMYYGPNIGEFETIRPIKNGKATWKESAEDYMKGEQGCVVDMAFSPDKVTLTTSQGQCGFGHNVVADGEFLRVK